MDFKLTQMESKQNRSMNAVQFDLELHKLLNPEVLSNEELRKTLNNLCITVPVDCLRGELLEIFKRVAMPLPQRNRRCWLKLESMDYTDDVPQEKVLDKDFNKSSNELSEINTESLPNVITLTSNIESVSLKEIPITEEKTESATKVILKRSLLLNQDYDTETKRYKLQNWTEFEDHEMSCL